MRKKESGYGKTSIQSDSFFIITVWLIYSFFMYPTGEASIWKAVLRECGKEHISFL
ncbi:hypothetical protein MKC97_17025 [[Clostridium] innocuum]|uniref:hypothetical protein n=1 Tax=Clostridium innocuum TaxID=1522 RepID=UPI000A56F408|nr:hypothetical protein [[Clostridium] innocuum]MCR0184586.1 hypothetical protein [[Clostridium] innocuum]